jgi:hypothetical protein
VRPQDAIRPQDRALVPGLPEQLPPGETLVWQGAPRWKTLARRGFHIRGLAIYFAVLLAWYVTSTLGDDLPAARTALDIARTGGIALAALGMVALFCWGVGRTTIYTITSRRVAIRFGIALPMTINIPFAKIESAAVKANPDGTGDILLTLAPDSKISYIIMWPHVRAWSLGRPQPMLRSIPDVVAVAQSFGHAVVATAERPVALGAVSASGGAARPDGAMVDQRPAIAAAA